MPFKVVPIYYHVWRSMKDRCTNQNSAEYANYGGRGITVCDRWINDYKTFEADMGPRPKGHSIDRIDVNGNYEPSNCRWANKRTQAMNRRSAVYVTVEGKSYRAITLAELAGVKTDTIIYRANKGRPLTEVIHEGRHHFYDVAAMVAGHKAAAAARTHCRNGHLFTEETTHLRKDGGRQCRVCHNEKMRRLNQKKRDALKASA